MGFVQQPVREAVSDNAPMPGHLLLAIALGAATIGGAAMLATVDRGTPVQGECLSKKRVISGTARIKRTEARKRCHVIMPILM